jgi:putative Mg2+ transporter-C (MgtC) family protein
MDVYAVDFWLKILVSVICGGIVGLERQLRGKPAGIRTSILICLGTEVFVSHGTSLSGGDQYRVLAQVVTGVGFLGAGLMISQEGTVRGVTSAAVIWVLAAIGSTIGLGHFREALVFVLVTVAVLSGWSIWKTVSGDCAAVFMPGSHFLMTMRVKKGGGFQKR